MCRHLAYLGEPVTIASVVFEPPHSLFRQAWEPRRQRHGTMNADGFGIGWYADHDPVPARYRRAGPIWSDECVTDLARVTRSRAMLCAVRSASPGTGAEASAAAPYAAGRWLFSLNGVLRGWSAAAGGGTAPGRQRAQTGTGDRAGTAGPAGRDEEAAAVFRLAGSLTPAELLGLQARCDTALLWALTQRRLRDGQPMPDALAGTIGDLRAAGATGRFNLLLTDGTAIAATAAGDTLCYRQRPGGVLVASEPYDDDDGWEEVPPGSVLEATPAAVTIRPLPTTTR